MDPVKSNIKSKSCEEPIGSNCIIVGDSITGSGLCKNSTLTDYLSSIWATLSTCCGAGSGSGTSTDAPCYTGSWVDFTSSIPASGTAGPTTYTLPTTFFGIGMDGITGSSIVCDLPSYKWTKEGNLQLKGTLALFFTAGAVTNTFVIDLFGVGASCFPVSTKKQLVLIESDAISSNTYSPNGIWNFFKAYVQFNNGKVQLVIVFNFNNGLAASLTVRSLSLGGVQFNLV